MLKFDLDALTKEIQKNYDGTLEENQSTLHDLVKILSDLVDSLSDAKIQIPQWKYHSQTLVNKIIFTAHSIINLSNGYDLQSFRKPELNVKVIDYSSIYILTRGLIENYVTLCYIYNNKLSDEEKLFRFKLWEMSGLLTRQNFEDPQNNFNLEKKDTEAKLIQTILSEIEKMDEFKSLDKRKLNKLKTHGLPRVENWHKLIDESNLKQPLFSNTYSLYSEYAHSEYLSILQIGQASLNSKNPGNISAVTFALGNTRMIIALCIKYYIENYKSTEIIFNTYPLSHRTVVNIWSKIADKSAKNR